MTSPEIEAFITEVFDQNFELLRQEYGSSLTPEAREAALNQVMLYWLRLPDVAERITDTEVPIQLPNQCSPEGRNFGIDGVVDIVREDDKTIMYDIKTHEEDFVREHLDLYAMQLNLYAYVWEQLRGQPLDEVAIIATAYPDNIRDAMPPGVPIRELDAEARAHLTTAIANWNPLIELEYNAADIDDTIRMFGETVDLIENRQFAPPSVSQLNEIWQMSGQRYAVRVCRICDARYSCSSYRKYAQERAPREWKLREFNRYYYEEADDQPAPEGWVAANLNASPEDAYLDALLGE